MKPKSFPKVVPHHCVSHWPALWIWICREFWFAISSPAAGRRGCGGERSIYEKLVTSFSVEWCFPFPEITIFINKMVSECCRRANYDFLYCDGSSANQQQKPACPGPAAAVLLLLARMRGV